jgi:hypothetical protein
VEESLQVSRISLFLLSLFLPGAAIAQAEDAVDADALPACIAAHKAGQERRLDNDWVGARERFRACASSGCPKLMIEQCSDWVRQAETNVPSVLIVVRDSQGRDVSDVKVTLDGSDLGTRWVGIPVETNPGSHRVVAMRRGERAERKFVAVLAEKQKKIEVLFAASPGERRAASGSQEIRSDRAAPPWAGYALLGVGAVAFGVGTYLGIDTLRQQRDLKECRGHCDADDVDRGKRTALLADVAFGVGLVSIALGGYLVLSADSGRKGAKILSLEGRF